MKKALRYVTVLTVLTLILTIALSACDLVRKVQGVEIKFQQKVQAAEQLSFDMRLTILDADGEQSLDVSCYKQGDEYAYTFTQPDDASYVYRRLYADNKLYEYLTKTRLHAGTYYVRDNVAYTADENLLYWVTQNIMLATYATLLTTGQKDTVNDVAVYRYDFSYDGNDYSLWYDDENLVKISATFRSTDTDGNPKSETYIGVFANYRFDEVDEAPFRRPEETTDAVYLESPISFEDWMHIIDRFGARVANWM